MKEIMFDKLLDSTRSYISEVINEKDILEFHALQSIEAVKFFEAIGEEKSKYKYAEGKWSIKQVLGHICDSERIFAARMIHIARGQEAKLPGFDENVFMNNSNFDDLALSDLVEQFKTMRTSNIALFKSFNEKMWDAEGFVDTYQISVWGMIYLIAGHAQHHINIIKERYLD